MKKKNENFKSYKMIHLKKCIKEKGWHRVGHVHPVNSSDKSKETLTLNSCHC